MGDDSDKPEQDRRPSSKNNSFILENGIARRENTKSSRKSSGSNISRGRIVVDELWDKEKVPNYAKPIGNLN